MKTLYTIFGLFILSIPALTQTSIEITAGPVFSNVSVRGITDALKPDRTLHTGLQAQVLASKNIGSNIEFMTGLSYKEKGFHIKESIDMDVLNIPAQIGVEAITTFRYIEVPLNLKYNISTGPIDVFAFAGPTLGYMMNGDVRTRANLIFDINISTTHLNLNQNIYNRLEIGGNIGAGIGIPIGHGSLNAQINYNQGFTKFLDNTLVDLRLKNYGFGMNIGYKLSL